MCHLTRKLRSIKENLFVPSDRSADDFRVRIGIACEQIDELIELIEDEQEAQYESVQNGENWR